MRKFALTVATKATESRWPKAQEQDLQFLHTVITHPRESDNKDGTCFVPGTLLGDSRKKEGVGSIDILVYDIDGGQALDGPNGVDAKLEEAGIFGWVYSTHSHQSTKTKIKADHFEKWAKRVGAATTPPTLQGIIDYLGQHDKQHIVDANPVFDMSDMASAKKHFEHSSDGMHFIIHHDPLEKYRVVIPLAERIVFTDLALVTRKAIDAYKSIYHGVGKALGLVYDRKCEDPSRLFYFPSHRVGAQDQYVARVYGDIENPKLLNVNDYPRAHVHDETTKKTSDGKKAAVTASDFIVNDKNGVPIDLLRWERNNYDFDIEALLQQTLPDEMVKQARSDTSGGGFHIECPFEANHTKSGGLGTFAANGDGDKSWVIYCSHNSCHEHKKLDFLKEFIKEGWITAEDLGVPLNEPSPKTEPPVDYSFERMELERVARALGVDPSTLPDLSLVDLGESDVTDEAILTDYQDREKDGDSHLSPEEVAEQALIDLMNALNIREARGAIGRVRAKGCDVTASDIAEMLSKGPMTRVKLSPLVREVARLYEDSYIDLMEEIKTARQDTFDINERIANLYAKRKTGRDLHRELTYIAEYFFIDRATVAKHYAEYENDLVLQEYGESIKDYFPQLNAQWAKLRQGSNVVYIDMLKSRQECAVVCLNPKGLEQWMKNKNIIIPSDKKVKNRRYLYKSWSEDSTLIREYDGITFHPGLPSSNNSGKFNLWSDKIGYKGFPLFPKSGDVSIITNHIKDVWCSGNDSDYNWVMTWLADILQNPGVKRTTSLVLLGPQGTGKSIIFEYALGKILGPYFGASGTREDVVGRFSGHLVGKLLWVSEETLFAGDKVSMNKLKDRVTSTTIDIEPKGVDKFFMPSFTRYVFTSNQVHALHLEADDRRFFVLGTSNIHQRDTKYFTNMRNWLDDGGAEKFMNFLLNWNPEDVGLTWNSLLDAPTSELKRRQAEMSYDVSDMFFLELLRYGRITDTPSSVFMEARVAWPLKGEDGSDTLSVKTESLRGAYEAYIRYHMGSGARFERGKFNTLFNRYIGVPLEQASKVKRVNKSFLRLVYLPSRESAIRRAVDLKYLTEADLLTALDDPTSHLYNEGED